MPIALETVVKQLTDSGIIAAGKLENFIPPKADPKDGEALLRELHKQKLLTTFQAQQLAANKIKALLLGNYTLIDKIGAGGMGQVFKAEHRRLERVVAIKMLPAATVKDAAAVARFQREVKAAAKLRHTNVVATDDADEANGVHFLVMEYVEGQDLSALVKKNGPFPVAKAVNYTLQAARGLEFAHSQGVIHRDIKPANLLLDKMGTVKILDMGLARIEGDAADHQLTSSGTVMGTVDYMAPEQAVSTRNADHRADIYSLGISLYYLIAAKAAYNGETAIEKLMAHQMQPIPSLHGVQAAVPQQLETVFNKMVAKKIEDRYQSMTEVIADLERCQASLSSSSASATVTTSASSDTQESEMTAVFGSRRMQAIPAVEAYEEPERKGPPWKNKKLLAGAGAAGFVFLLLGVIVIFRNQKGEEVGRMELPDGTSVEVQASAKVDPVLPAKPITTFKEPAFQQWMKEVQAMPAEEQIKAVSKKLMDLNPGFDGTLLGHYGNGVPQIENGVVTELAVPTFNVIDISPVRALIGLKVLMCESRDGRGKLSSLSPLQGMSLTGLSVTNSPVSDLSSLQNMPLKGLTITNTAVSDLSPLKGIKLLELRCINTQVSDLSPLMEMPLTFLALGGSKIKDLAPLQGMPLTSLECDRMQLSDLSALKGMKLTILLAFNTQLSDLSPLKGMPLTKVNFRETLVSDLSPLHDCPNLTWLDVQHTKVTPASVAALQKALPNCKIEWDDPAKVATTQRTQPWNTPAFQAWVKEVQAMPAEEQVKAVSKKLIELNPRFDGKLLRPVGNGGPKIESGVVTGLRLFTDNVNDISPVQALTGLKDFYCNGSPIGKGKLFDLSPLEGLRLTRLHCHDTQVADLSPLEECQSLSELKVARTKVTAAQVAALQKALPNCKIEWDDPAKPKTSEPAAQVDHEREVAEWVLSIGGKVDVNVGGAFKTKVTAGTATRSFEGGKDTKGISDAKDLPTEGFTLRGINLHGNIRLSGADLTKLIGLRGLQSLILIRTSVSDGDTEIIQRLPDLTFLDVSNSKVTDAGLISIAQIKTLDDLHLEGNAGISDIGIKELVRIQDLRRIGISTTKASSSVLTDLPTLTHVGVDAHQAESLPHLDKLVDLLIDTPNDGCIEHLCSLKLKNLSRIAANGSGWVKVSKQNIEALKKAYPNCKIEGAGIEKLTTPAASGTK